MRPLKWLLIIISILSSQAFASWTLQNEQSRFYFTFTKNTDLTTTARFHLLEGFINDNGQAQLSIALRSLESGIAKRDQRLKDLFFKVAINPEAKIEVALSQRLLNKLKPGQTTDVKVSAKVILNGKSVRIRENLAVTFLTNNQVEVATTQPILLNTADFGYTQPLATLVKLAGVNNISKTVIITFRLNFSSNDVFKTVQ